MANLPISDMKDTWSSAATTFDAIKMNVADAASAADSKLINLQIGGSARLTVDKAGNLVAAGAASAKSLALAGPITVDPGVLLVLNGGTTVIDFATKSRRQIELRSSANMLDVRGIPVSGGELELDILSTEGTLAFAQTIRWKLGSGAESTNLASTGVVLTAGVRYTVVLWNMGGNLYGGII